METLHISDSSRENSIEEPTGFSSTQSEGSIESCHSMQESGDSSEATRLRDYHLELLKITPSRHEIQEIMMTPIFTMPVLKHAESLTSGCELPIAQYGLLAGISDAFHEDELITSDAGSVSDVDPRIFWNVTAPSSTFICGSQGSGKSHTLSCMLENCLMSSDAGQLSKPLEGLVFHYDTFISDQGGSPCEAAFLASNPQIRVRVLCAPTNLNTMKRTYGRLNVSVEPLRIKQHDLNTKRILDLMAVTQGDGTIPLYIHTIYRILREMRMSQQALGSTFNYQDFKRQIMAAALSPAQLGPLNQRLDTLESFMPDTVPSTHLKKKPKSEAQGTNWQSQPNSLTIVDLSCPCVTAEGACALFNICLSLFLEQKSDIGRVIALDEAHKYMNTSAEALTFTETLLSTIRLQRHLGARIIISTQEPTISPTLLDLSSITIVHRFTSPEWLRTLKDHLAAAASNLLDQVEEPNNESNVGRVNVPRSKRFREKELFRDIVNLRIGEALLFAPSAIVDLEMDENDEVTAKRLVSGYLKIRVRARLTTDGGKSVMAS